MKKLTDKLRNRTLRKNRIRAVVSGTPERPRLSVHVSNKHVSAQLIDDVAGKTLGYITTVGQKAATGTMTERAAWVGGEIAKQAKTKKIKQVVFDRSGKLYHGRVQALADAAREQGLEF
jgi:large subunit ribosomal protein L18